MSAFNFDSLTPTDFEIVALDILHVKYGFDFHRFGEGKDDGIDFEYRDISKDYRIIGQAKRYKSVTNLLFILEKEELPKVIKLQPDRYILITTSSLHSKDITKILELFKGYIKDFDDIIHKERIEELLRRCFKI